MGAARLRASPHSRGGWWRSSARTVPAKHPAQPRRRPAAPTTGEVTVLDGVPAGSRAALDGVAFVAQDTPLYRYLSAADMIHLTRNLNQGFDDAYARASAQTTSTSREAQGRLAVGRSAGPAGADPRAGPASSAPRARRAHRVARPARPPRLHGDRDDGHGRGRGVGPAVLARARRARAGRGLPRADLTRPGPARRRRRGTARPASAAHRPRRQSREPRWRVIQSRQRGAQQHLLVGRRPRLEPPGWEARPVSLEELTMAYLRENAHAHAPRTLGGDPMTARRPGRRAAPRVRPVPWRSLAWVTWRRHRATVAATAAVLPCSPPTSWSRA